MQSNFNEDDGKPVDHSVRNASVFGRVDYNLNAKNQIFGSYSFDWSKNPNQTFDVPTYGTTANGIEGPSKIQVFNTSWYSTVSNNKLYEGVIPFDGMNDLCFSVHLTPPAPKQPPLIKLKQIPVPMQMGGGQ